MSAAASHLDAVAGVARFRDTCNVYVLRSGTEAVLIDFGSGAVLDHLGELGVERVTDVLLTHHHRDQAQGLRRAVDAGIRIWAPPVDAPLLAQAGTLWRRRKVENDYDLRQDRFSVAEDVPLAGTVAEYRTTRFGDFDVYALPTPGHTVGSLTYVVGVGGRRLAFSGDLVYGDGRLWSLAATQWSYSGVEGLAATHVSCGVLADHEPDVLLPAHGDPVAAVQESLTKARARVQELVDMRALGPWDLEDMRLHPWRPVTPHLLRNRASFANSYALLSETGAALIVDFGYDVTTGLTPTTERWARRALLWPLDALRRDHGVERIEVAVPTHFHDDHVAGLNLLREVEGTVVWAPENVAPVLEAPARYDLPCLWFDPIAVDRALPLGEPVRWHEYELTVYPLPGHTLHAAAISFEVDGRRVLAVGDQQTGDDDRSRLNYQYRNRFRLDDFVASAALYRALRPDLIVSGHWGPQEVTDELLDQLEADGARLAELHRELLPLEDVDFGAEGFGARIEPYRSLVAPGGEVALEVAVLNPFDREETATVRLAAPAGWTVEPAAREAALGPKGTATVPFVVRAPADAPPGRRVLAADLTVGAARFGQQAEALVEVGP
jgi:glyoxylase-like metal-dependent hydrolase (beta-lactamase superfamily II)